MAKISPVFWIHSQAADSNTLYFSSMWSKKKKAFSNHTYSVSPCVHTTGIRASDPPTFWGEGGWRNWKTNPVFLALAISSF